MEEKTINQATQRALRRTVTTLKTHAKRQLSQQHQIPQKILNNRIRTRSSKQCGTLWVGLNPVPIIKLGRVRQTKSGVIVGKHNYSGAFIAKMPSGHMGVFRRSTKARLPIEEIKIKLDNGEQTISGYAKQKGLTYFHDRLEHELLFLLDKLK